MVILSLKYITLMVTMMVHGEIGMKMQTTHTLMTEVHYVNCKEDGPWRTWYRYRDYALESERYFVDGRLDGV